MVVASSNREICKKNEIKTTVKHLFLPFTQLDRNGIKKISLRLSIIVFESHLLVCWFLFLFVESEESGDATQFVGLRNSIYVQNKTMDELICSILFIVKFKLHRFLTMIKPTLWQKEGEKERSSRNSAQKIHI